ncbi:MAG: ABC transporter permease [Acidobacteriaceae bacterium]|nr:ABC transporter permease [Acidobacteriaceae bacterium]
MNFGRWFKTRQQRREELHEEIESHLRMATQDSQERGEPDSPSRVRRNFGNVTSVEEITQEMWGWASLERLGQDLRYALRQLRKSPGFTAVVILMLAIGIGANTAVFSIFNAVLLSKPPYRDPRRLVVIKQTYPTMGAVRLNTSPAEYLDYRDKNRIFTSLAGYNQGSYDLTGSGTPERIEGIRATSNFFATLGVTPQLGRVFTPSEDRRGAANVAVLSYAFWQRDYSGSAKVLGSALRLNEKLYTVIGVMPPGFEFPATETSVDKPPALWVPMAYSQDEIRDRAASYDTSVVGRLKPDITVQQGQKHIQGIADQFQHDLPQFYVPSQPLRVTVEPLGAEMTARAKPVLFTLTAAVAFVLLIACANVANLLLARSQVRQREMAVRNALGASVQRLMRQLLTETLALTLLGGIAGVAGAALLIHLAAHAWPERVVGLGGVHIDSAVLFFTLCISVGTGLLCGLAPALGWTKPDLNNALKQASRHIGSTRMGARFQNALVVVEVASATVLLVGAGLLIHSFVELLKAPPGFDPKNVLFVRTTFNRARYPESNKRREGEHSILAKLRALPNVEEASLTSHIPLADERQIGFVVEGRAPNEFHWADNALVSGDYFTLMRIPIKRGRTFDERDTLDHPLSIVINESMARQYWPHEDALGKRVRWGGRMLTIIGIAGDVRLQALDAAPGPTIYGDVFQAESGASTSAVFLLRTKLRESRAVAQVRKIIWSVDGGLPVFESGTMNDVVSRSLATRQFLMILLVGFAFTALLLAIIGLYGVLAYTVQQRTQELGVRLALGAQPSQVTQLILSNGAKLAITGLLLGLLASLGASRMVSALLFGIRPLDPWTFTSATLLLFCVALLASYGPARRAAQVDPMIALRFE